MSIDWNELAKPFELEDLEWRTLRVMNYNGIQAMIAPYVTARAVTQRLNDVCGPENWNQQFQKWDKGQLCRITICDQFKEDGAENTQIEPLKGGLSDAFKRAAVHWGIGHYLYSLPPMKAQILDKWEPGANKGEVKAKNDVKRETFWWKPNAAAIEAVKAASEGK